MIQCQGYFPPLSPEFDAKDVTHEKHSFMISELICLVDVCVWMMDNLFSLLWLFYSLISGR